MSLRALQPAQSVAMGSTRPANRKDRFRLEQHQPPKKLI